MMRISVVLTVMMFSVCYEKFVVVMDCHEIWFRHVYLMAIDEVFF